jgi:catechol 2,3-dioxygenase-like lactoylglutathione lyase family enzyme
MDKVPMIMTRVILYVRDVDLLKNFYRTHFDVPVVEEIPGEWAVLKAGEVELALHRVGPEYRRDAPAANGEPHDGSEEDSDDGTASNAKLVFMVKSRLPELRDRLLAAGVKMRDLKRYAGFAMLMCDGVDPEGNVFQLSQPDA